MITTATPLPPTTRDETCALALELPALSLAWACTVKASPIANGVNVPLIGMALPVSTDQAPLPSAVTV
jgi:hypothetical protein